MASPGRSAAVKALAALVVIALIDASIASGIARLSLVLIAFLGLGLVLYLSTHGYDRAVLLLPTWFLLVVWVIAAGMTVGGSVTNDIVGPALLGGLVLIVMLIGFTVMQHAFAGGGATTGVVSDVERRALALTGAGDMIWDWDVSADRVYTSPETEHLLGLKRGALEGPASRWLEILHALDRGCTRSGCTAPGYWCQAHHVEGWANDDGPTDITKLTLACGPDNRLVEEGGWTTRKRKDGRTEWIPPPHLDTAPGEGLVELVEVRVAVVVRVEHLGLERGDALRGLGRRHRVRQVHAHEGDVDARERLHLRDALGIAGEVEALLADLEDIAVASALVVVELPLRRPPLQVVHRQCLDGHEAEILDARPDGGRGGLYTALTRSTRALAIVHAAPLPAALRQGDHALAA